MPLPATAIERELIHTRKFHFEGYKRTDGLWDLEAHIIDFKSQDHPVEAGVRRAGEPVHDMRVRITIDRDFNVLDAYAISDAVPYPGGCEHYGDAYRSIIGLNLLKAFRKRVHERLGGVKGCTHITEMLGSLPTVAIQTFAGDSRAARDDTTSKPWHLDQCHAMDTTKETVRKWYPKWYAGKPAAGEDKGERAA
jgi:hypothetical protein